MKGVDERRERERKLVGAADMRWSSRHETEQADVRGSDDLIPP
jgi:hypothetical protein